MSQNNYPPEQIKKAISILLAMLQPNAPELSEEFDLYYKYIKDHYTYKYELNNKLNEINRLLTKKLCDVQNPVEKILSKEN
jgi:hypothetical protein